MPAIPSIASILESSLVHRDVLTLPLNSTIASRQALEVICAWPVSGQYGPGTRALYYILLAACVVARKVEWIRNACLAAVLLFPAIAALHAVALVLLHVEGAVDMDVYGAFQLCAIGILTVPATWKLSQTYFDTPGRNIIFLWTLLLLAGIISLIVEFMRLEGIPVPSNETASIAWAMGKGFPYGDPCGLHCTPGDGPTSSLREGSTDNIYVVPTPSKLSFNTTTLLAAACCIPAILSLVSMGTKILDDNREKLGGKKKQNPNKPIEGTNGATPNHMIGIGKTIKACLSLIEIPIMAAAVLAILIKGEMNFWSPQVYYQTEPITSIGQWAPIVGSGLAVLGSLYLLLANAMEDAAKGLKNKKGHIVIKCTACGKRHTIKQPGNSPQESGTAVERQPDGIQMVSRRPTDKGGRKKVAQFFVWASARLAAKAHEEIEKGGFSQGERLTYPECPGEEQKNSKLQETREKYGGSSRAPSLVSSRDSLDHGEGSSMDARSLTRRRESSPISVPLPTRHRQSHDDSGSLPNNGLLHSASHDCPRSSLAPSGGWSDRLNPFSDQEPRRSRAYSGSMISPTTLSPPTPTSLTIIITPTSDGND